jgi:hypothetical protein
MGHPVVSFAAADAADVDVSLVDARRMVVAMMI